MPKVEIDYSNTIIYKITCNDPNIKDVYVGHTTNFVQRKHAHKQSCINEKSLNNKCKLYNVIRNNGGWINWSMEIIHFFSCNTHYEARIKEQEYFVLLNANLNSIEPMPPKKPKLVKSSLYASVNVSGIQPLTPCAIDSNQNEIISDISTNNTKKHQKYVCETCDFITSNKKDYARHLLTPKHIKLSKCYENASNILYITPNIVTFNCNCGKEYKHDSSYYRHKKKCSIKPNIYSECENTDKEDDKLHNNSHMILEILKQNQEFKEMILEKPVPVDTNDSLIIELLKQNQDFKNLMIEQNKYMMEQSKQMMELMKTPFGGKRRR